MKMAWSIQVSPHSGTCVGNLLLQAEHVVPKRREFYRFWNFSGIILLEELSGLHHESLSPQNGVCFQVTQPNFSLGSRSATQRNADLWFHLPGKSNLTPSGGHGCASADSPQALRLRDQREVFSCNDGFIGAQATYS
jgi:hypothetical protein